MSRTLILAVAAALAALAPGVAAAQPLTDEQIVRAAGPWLHGTGSIPDAYRSQVLSEPRAPRVFRELLEGRRTTELTWDTATALWWLAQTDDPGLTAVFVRYSDDAHGEAVAAAALYGLARRGTHPEAAARLRQALSASEPQWLPEVATVILLHVGDAPARGLLASASGRRLSGRLREHAGRFRDSPPRADQGRWPCSPAEVLQPDAGGVWKCAVRPAGPFVP